MEFLFLWILLNRVARPPCLLIQCNIIQQIFVDIAVYTVYSNMLFIPMIFSIWPS